MDELAKGQDYEKLKDSYVIFICTYDMFGKGLHQYNFRYICGQVRDLPLGDGTETIILSTRGTENDVNPDLLAFLRYVESSTDETAAELDNELVNRIHEKVKTIKRKEGMEVEYLKFEELMRESREEGFSDGLMVGRSQGHAEGRSEGIAEGENLLAALISRLLSDGRSEDAALASNKKEARIRFYREYGLIDEAGRDE